MKGRFLFSNLRNSYSQNHKLCGWNYINSDGTSIRTPHLLVSSQQEMSIRPWIQLFFLFWYITVSSYFDIVGKGISWSTSKVT